MTSPWASSRSVTTTHHSSCSRAGRRCSPGRRALRGASPPVVAELVRYDLRDSGEFTTADPEAPAYTLRDLAADAAALVEALGGAPAHLAGIGVGGMVAQVAALDHPGAFSALTLVGTRSVAPGPPDDDLPYHDQATMSRLFGRPMPDWTDREAVGVRRCRRGDPRRRRRRRARDCRAHLGPHARHRTPGPDGQPDRHGVPKLTANPAARTPSRDRAPTLVVHGRRDLFFPVGNGEAIAREIPGARLLVLEEAATAIPRRRSARSPRRCSPSDSGRRVPRGSGLHAAVDVGGSIRPRARDRHDSNPRLSRTPLSIHVP